MVKKMLKLYRSNQNLKNKPNWLHQDIIIQYEEEYTSEDKQQQWQWRDICRNVLGII